MIDLFNTSDSRCILIEDGEPEELDMDGVDINELNSACESIVKEWEELRGSNEYSNHLRDSEFYLYKKCEMHGLNLIEVSLKHGYKDIAIEVINEFKFNIKPDKADVERKKKLLNNWFRLYKDKHPEEDSEGKSEKIVWEELKVYTEYALGNGYKIDNDCTAADFAAYEKLIKQIEALKKRAANGKEN